ncbi:hypothetical protein Lalb_Chr13g0295101 [Lupinus albus]|uniref:Uncharacterized protein n=1 Tax=Lupinus albus TaxID=3870 RepID=A0A6A4PI13_LUPAL|nr:hypothetical protein Lalb_Chr13g0295101 [Lupinus albus]
MYIRATKKYKNKLLVFVQRESNKSKFKGKEFKKVLEIGRGLCERLAKKKIMIRKNIWHKKREGLIGIE